MKENKLVYVDSLRGVAILMVITVHTAQSVNGINIFGKLLCDYGQMGVQLFFFLSAYTLCASLENNKYGRKWLLAFYTRRYFRIAPLYYLGILLYCFLSFFFSFLIQHSTKFLALGNNLINGPKYSFKNILSNILFVHNFYYPARDKIVPGGWSIGAEMAFYLIFPFIFLFYKRTLIKKSQLYLSIMPLIAFLFSYSLVRCVGFFFSKSTIVQENNGFVYFNLFNQLPVFIIGISFYFYSNYIRQQINIYLSIFGFLLWSCISIVIFHYYFDVTIVPFVTSLSYIFLFFIFKQLSFFNFSLLQNIGKLSFSIYIFHFVFAWPLSAIIVHVSKKYFSMDPNLLLILCLLICIFLSIMVSKISKKYIEDPGITFGKRLIKNYFSNQYVH